jgi:hypothetical protein
MYDQHEGAQPDIFDNLFKSELSHGAQPDRIDQIAADLGVPREALVKAMKRGKGGMGKTGGKPGADKVVNQNGSHGGINVGGKPGGIKHGVRTGGMAKKHDPAPRHLDGRRMGKGMGQSDCSDETGTDSMGNKLKKKLGIGSRLRDAGRIATGKPPMPDTAKGMPMSESDDEDDSDESMDSMSKGYQWQQIATFVDTGEDAYLAKSIEEGTLGVESHLPSIPLYRQAEQQRYARQQRQGR